MDTRIRNSKWDHYIEKSYGDTDLKAAEASILLFDQGVIVLKIQRAFSVGAFGQK
jgi:hypothetical protein